MKKVKKELNKILKLFLALSLLLNNLMPMSTVFAMEDSEEEIVEKLENDDKPSEKAIVTGENDDEENPVLDPDEGEDEEVSDEGETDPSEEESTNEVALTYQVYVDDAAYEDDYGWVELDKEVSKVDIVVRLSGAFATEDYTFTYGENEYTAEDLLNGVIIETLTFEGYLYGMFSLDVYGTLVDPDGNATPYEMSYGIGHGTDTDNDEALNAATEDYVFSNGVITTTNYNEEALMRIIKEVFPNATVEFEDNEVYLSDDHGVMVWYGIVTKGDVNGDGKINQEDLELLINQILGLEEVTENSDVNDDGEVNDLDAAYLKLMLETGYTGDVIESDAIINAKFDEFNGPVKVGDEFTLDYIVTLSEYTINGISGLVKYDKNLLELISAEAKTFSIGDMNEDKFLYLGEWLELDIEQAEDEEGNWLYNEDGSPKLIFNDTDYVIVSLTFKALDVGNATVSMDDIKYFCFDEYYIPDSVTSIDVTIEGEEQEESPFISITVGSYDVDLSTYKLTVPNDVTATDLQYVLADENYSASFMVPQELVVGENTIVITVNMNGVEKEYTIIVTREAKEEEQTEDAQVVAPVSYVEPTYDDDDKDEDVVVTSTPSDALEDEETSEDSGKLSRALIIILILLAIAGLIYLIFKDDKDDEETKKANRDIDKMKKEDDKKIKNDNHKKVKKKGR